MSFIFFTPFRTSQLRAVKLVYRNQRRDAQARLGLDSTDRIYRLYPLEIRLHDVIFQYNEVRRLERSQTLKRTPKKAWKTPYVFKHILLFFITRCINVSRLGFHQITHASLSKHLWIADYVNDRPRGGDLVGAPYGAIKLR